MSGEVPVSMNLDWPNRLFLDRSAYRRVVLPAHVLVADETAQKAVELAAEVEADLKKRYPELDEDYQRQATS